MHFKTSICSFTDSLFPIIFYFAHINLALIYLKTSQGIKTGKSKYIVYLLIYTICITVNSQCDIRKSIWTRKCTIKFFSIK